MITKYTQVPGCFAHGDTAVSSVEVLGPMEYSLAIFVLCVSLCLYSVESVEHPPVLPSSGKKLQGSVIK